MPITYLYALPDGKVSENAANLPADSLATINRQKGLVLRVAYDSEANRVYIQDGAFRRLLADGDRVAWHYLNQTLLHLRKNFNAKFPERAYGDPPGTAQSRMFSQYRKAWKRVGRYLKSEFQMSPADVPVCEYVPEPGFQGEAVAFGNGGTCAGKQVQGPAISVNRFAGGANGDADYGKVNRFVGDIYLDRLDEIMAAFPQLRFGERVKQHRNAFGGEVMFAKAGRDGKTEIFRTRQSEHPEARDEEAIRRLDSMKGYEGPLVVFQFMPPRRISLLNFSSLEMSKDPALSAMLRDIKSAAARLARGPEDRMVVTFEPSLSMPFIADGKRYEALMDFIRGWLGVDPEGVPVVELPLAVQGLAALIQDSESEERLCPGCQRFRALRGMAMDYPFMAVDARGPAEGMRLAAMARAYCSLIGKETPKVGADQAGDPEKRQKVAETMAYMFAMGLGKKDAVDFFADRGKYRDRAAMWEIADEAWASPPQRTASASRMVRTAEYGPGLGINDWWYLGLQETMNRSKHVWNKPGTESFNLKDEKKKPKGPPETYEEMLDPQRDKQMSSQKTTEQLLRESRV